MKFSFWDRCIFLVLDVIATVMILYWIGVEIYQEKFGRQKDGNVD